MYGYIFTAICVISTVGAVTYWVLKVRKINKNVDYLSDYYDSIGKQ